MLSVSQAHVIVALCLPVFAAIFSLFCPQRSLRNVVTILLALATCMQLVWVGPMDALTLVELAPGLDITLQLDRVGLIFALVASGLWAITALYADGYMRSNAEPRQPRFFFCFNLSIAAALLIACSGNLFTLFLGYEILSLSTFPLVTHTQSSEAKRAGRVYLGILMGSSIALFLPLVILLWLVTGDTQFDAVLNRDVSLDSIALIGPLFFAMAVFGVAKTAIMPLHKWLPAAMVAPTPVSALLHAVAVVKAGVFTLIKIMYFTDVVPLSMSSACFKAGDCFWSYEWLTYLAGFTVIMASIIACYQDSIKKRLAYSTISQLSYIVMAASLFSAWALKAALVHLIVHAVSKITLFFAAGNIYTAQKKTRVSELNGIGKTMPVTMIAFTIGALSMIGLPPTAGLWSKWFILQAGFMHEHLFVIMVLIISTMLNAAYFMPIIIRAFFATPENAAKREAPLSMQVAISITALLTLALFWVIR